MIILFVSLSSKILNNPLSKETGFFLLLKFVCENCTSRVASDLHVTLSKLTDYLNGKMIV